MWELGVSRERWGAAMAGADVSLGIIWEIDRISSGGSFSGLFKKDCVELVRRISLIVDFLEEIRDSEKIQRNDDVGSSSSRRSCFADLTLVLHEAKGLLLAAKDFSISANSSVMEQKRILSRFQCVTSKMEMALANFPYYHFDISEEAQEHVELARKQLIRAAARYENPDPSLSLPSDSEIDPSLLSNKAAECLENSGRHESQDKLKAGGLMESEKCGKCEITVGKEAIARSSDKVMVVNSPVVRIKEIAAIPADFVCPISLELMRDPVIVATGQTYERSCIQRWIDCGHKTCPKTQQKLHHLGLTPNYLLRRLISQWCSRNNAHSTSTLINGDITAIRALICKLCSRSAEDIRAAVAEIRLLSRRSTDNRILLAEAGAIPVLVNLMASQDGETQDNAITCILNLSIYENNKGLIVLADAIPLIVQVLRNGSMEAKENAAAALFCLSQVDEYRVTIGASGAIPPLVDLLKSGRRRGRKDAATALYTLCLYPRNKGRAVKAGILVPLLNMLTDKSSRLVDESLTIIAVLASHLEAKVAMAKMDMIPALIELLRSESPRNKENASSILLSLCKRDEGSLASARVLGAIALISELATSGTERGKRKAQSLLELLNKRKHHG